MCTSRTVLIEKGIMTVLLDRGLSSKLPSQIYCTVFI